MTSNKRTYVSVKKVLKKIKYIILTPFIVMDYYRFKKIDSLDRFQLSILDFQPQIFDRTLATGLTVIMSITQPGQRVY